MKRVFHWLDENLEEFLLVIGLIAMTLIMAVVFAFCNAGNPALQPMVWTANLG